MKPNLRTLLLLGSLTLATSGFAWNETGQMVIASIGDGRLDKDAWTVCDRLLKIGGSTTTKSFTQSGCWRMDAQTPETAAWERIDLPYRADGRPLSVKPGADEQNVVWAINHFSDILKDKSKPDTERSEALRYLISLVADVHQPLNAIRMETDQNPKGDQGGALAKVKAAELFPTTERPPTNLRELWDMGCGVFMPGAEKRPLDGAAEGRLQIQGIDLTSEYPLSTFGDQAKDLNPMDWAKESYQTAINFTYKVRTGGVIDLLYITEGKTICGQRAALAGYRLANLLNKLVGKG